MNEFKGDIAVWKAQMTAKQKIKYICTYYWYHMLGLCALLGLAVFLIVHFTVEQTEIAFTCVLVNQQIDDERDQELAQMLADFCGLGEDEVVVDSNYNFSYPGVELEDVNESSFEKFFLKWSNGELDAVVMTESFLEYCVSVGGTFCDVGEFDTGELEIYEYGDITGIKIHGTLLEEYLEDGEDGEWILVFPATGNHKDVCQRMVELLLENV